VSDVYQTGVISTLHRLGSIKLEKIESELIRYSAIRPVALVLPSLYSELEGAALPRIVEELKNVRYIRQIVVSLGRADRRQFEHARNFFSVLPQETTIIWNDGDRVSNLRHVLEENGLEIGPDGKGRSAWTAYGYVLGARKAEVIALHDCDILTYSRELLARLVYPVMNPNLGFEFCKGFYARYTDKMYGRVTRLLVTPLVRTLKVVLQPHPLLDYLDSFRYALAGEFSMNVDLARVNRIPCDWGLEVGVLAEVYRNTSVKRICQSDLCEVYEHKHQALDPASSETGLLKMCIDICKNLFRTLASEGIVISQSDLKTVLARYQRLAEDMVDRYNADAAINGLLYERHVEEGLVETFANGIRMAGDMYLEDPLGIALIPNWNRVASALPDFLERLKSAVDEDNKS
jgi:glucosyl-3-phosphoglycerate synthase